MIIVKDDNGGETLQTRSGFKGHSVAKKHAGRERKRTQKRMADRTKEKSNMENLRCQFTDLLIPLNARDASFLTILSWNLLYGTTGCLET